MLWTATGSFSDRPPATRPTSNSGWRLNLDDNDGRQLHEHQRHDQARSAPASVRLDVPVVSLVGARIPQKALPRRSFIPRYLSQGFARSAVDRRAESPCLVGS